MACSGQIPRREGETARARLVAHRGQMATCPENTLIALETALRCGAPAVEFDLQSTRDGVLVVSHDVELRRVTGREGNLFEMPLEALAAFRVCEPQRFPPHAFCEPIPTLGDLVALLQRYPGVTAFAEIKAETVDRFGAGTVCKRLLEMIRPIRRQVVIISFHQEAIRYLRDHSPQPTGYVLKRYDAGQRALAQRLRPDYLIVNHTKLDGDRKPWAGDWQWMLYDIVDPGLYRKHAEDVAWIETGDICGMLKHSLRDDGP